MKLNNHGWGLREMIIFSSILLLFLLLSVILIMQLYDELDTIDDTAPVVEDINMEYYRNKEYELKEAARLYVQEMGLDLSNGSINIYIHELITGGYINYFNDQVTGNYCDGYAKIYEEFGIMYLDSYIKCDNYMTEGYVG